MGTLRFLLALSVVIFHTTALFGLSMLSGPLAVHAFFIISGFYMSLILNEKYIKKNGSYFLFISNRILRIYPLYLITIFAILFFALLKFSLGQPGPENFFYHFYIYFTHIPNNGLQINILFDLVNYLVKNITLIFTTDYFFLFTKNPSPLILPQAWSLQCEMLFYLMAPFIVRRNIKTLTILSIAYILFFFGFINRSNLFPKNLLLYTSLFSLLFFSLGIWSYKLYVIMKNKHIPPLWSYLAFGSVIVYTVFYQFVPVSFVTNNFIATNLNYCFLIALVCPFIFILGQKSSLDKFLGLVSYPVFITHVFFIKVFDNIPGLHPYNSFNSLFLVGATLFFSWIFVEFVDKRINDFRQERVKK